MWWPLSVIGLRHSGDLGVDPSHDKQDPRRNIRKCLPAIVSKQERRPGKPVQKSRWAW